MPGVYRMFDKNKALLYAGKAKNLKKRLSSYFSPQRLSARMSMMMMHACHLEFTVTQTEAEALLLESNIIKHSKPRYNILLRDDKSYPRISITRKDDYPRVALHRGAQRAGDRYFGPYPSTQAARQTTHLLYKLFRLRQCSDSVFKNRSRPCLQYQIKRCSAPCVNFISEEEYAGDVDLAIEFLSGDSRRLIERLIARMDQATKALEYEKAARYRDQIQTLRKISEQHYVSGADQGEIDIMACRVREGAACVQVFSVRRGLHIGNRAYYPRLPDSDVSEEEVLAAFISQYYLQHPVPIEIILSHKLENQQLITTMLTEKSGRGVRLTHSVRTARGQWLKLAISNAKHALDGHLLSKASQRKKMQSLARLLGFKRLPERLECFDVSHTMGEETVASCVVFTAQGPCKEAYRLFNIRNETAGDDYAALAQALQRRYTHEKDKEEPETQCGEGSKNQQNTARQSDNAYPAVLFIDGGKGQLNAAHRALAKLGMDDTMLIGVAKGEGRKAGRETLYRLVRKTSSETKGRPPETRESSSDAKKIFYEPAFAKKVLLNTLKEKSNSYDEFMGNNQVEAQTIDVIEKEKAGFYLILQMRDEAHRFAIQGHRKRRARKRRRSPLESIPGLGVKRRQKLLRYFGGAQGIANASITELSKVPGISDNLASSIYASLRERQGQKEGAEQTAKI